MQSDEQGEKEAFFVIDPSGFSFLQSPHANRPTLDIHRAGWWDNVQCNSDPDETETDIV